MGFFNVKGGVEFTSQSPSSSHKAALTFFLKSCLQWLRKAQSIMSRIASNYTMEQMGFGLTLATLGFILAVITAFRTTKDDFRSWAPFWLITASYCIMTFATSYVEEEHQFWYWSLTPYLVFIGLRSFYGYGTVAKTARPARLLTRSTGKPIREQIT